MHDSNGKRLQVGDDFHTYRFGMCRILSISSDGESMCAQAYKGGDGLEYTQEEFAAAFPEVIKVPTWKEMAEAALQVQDACNLSGVVKSFATVVSQVRYRLEHEGNGGTDAINNHPVCVMWSSKIGSLTSSESTRAFREAYEWACERKAG